MIEADATRCPWCGKHIVPEEKAAKIEQAKAYIDDDGNLQLARSNCTECGAEMAFNEEQKRFECPYCGATAIVPESSINNIDSAPTAEEDDWDYSRPPAELPPRAIAFQISEEQAGERLRDILDVQQLVSWWRRKKSLKILAMNREFYPAYNIHVMTRSVWEATFTIIAELSDQDIVNLASGNPLPFSGAQKLLEKDFAAGMDLTAHRHLFLPAGHEIPELLKKSGVIDFAPQPMQLLDEIADPPPDGWPQPKISFTQAIDLMRQTAVNVEYLRVAELLPPNVGKFACDTRVDVRTGGLVYLPLWRASFTVGRNEHSCVLDGVTGETMFSTYS